MLNRCSTPFIPALLFFIVSPSNASDCGVPGEIVGDTVTLTTRVFADGSIAVRAPLAVNPDGGSNSYTVGDHGFTYIANGISTWNSQLQAKKCKTQCRIDFLEAENKGFAKGTREFCVYAMEVESLHPGEPVTKCGDGRRVIGNGKGRLKLGKPLKTVAGRDEQAYVSMTSLKHTVDEVSQYLDSESLPIAVTPDKNLLGSIAWVGGDGFHAAYALIGDKGPNFGEGSIALHQLLRTGEVSQQQIGPIPLDQRCGAIEMNLKAPFISMPDAKGDECRRDYKAVSQSDIRAYKEISSSIDFVILGRAKFLTDKSIINEEVTINSIKKVAEQAGYTDKRIQDMLACLPQPGSD